MRIIKKVYNLDTIFTTTTVCLGLINLWMIRENTKERNMYQKEYIEKLKELNNKYK